MDINQKINEAITKLNGLLEGANDLGELKSSLKSEYSSFVSHWNQCAWMTRLENYNALTVKINEITNVENTWFYIGYTERLGQSYYLWDKIPESEKFRQRQSEHNLVKSHTYYTHLKGKKEETEHNLINMFVQDGVIHPKCLNVRESADKSTNGIVYVLVYKPNN